MPLSELPVNRETHSQATTWLLPELFGGFIIISKKNNPIFQMFITGKGWWWRCGDESGTGKSRVSEVHCRVCLDHESSLSAQELMLGK